MRFKLDNNLALTLEPLDKRVRLIISENNQEQVCRKETFRNLEKFLQSDDEHIFKGRLQLHKDNKKIRLK